MLQLVYISSARNKPDVTPILATSRRNNGRDSITGFLYGDGVRFLQALEGPDDMVEAAFARIQRDERHRAVVVLSRRQVDRREFGNWQMAHKLPDRDTETLLAQVRPMLAHTTPTIRATFEGMMEVRRFC